MSFLFPSHLLALTLAGFCLLNGGTALSAAGSPPRPTRSWQVQMAPLPEYIACPTTSVCPCPLRQPVFRTVLSLHAPTSAER